MPAQAWEGTSKDPADVTLPAPKLSILIVQAGPPSDLERTTDSLARQQHVSPADFEVVAGGDDLGPLLALAAAPLLGVICGAPVLSRRLVEHVLAAAQLFEHPLVVVPGYEHDSLDLPGEPEALFEGARLSPLNPRGYLTPLLGSEAFFLCTSTLRKLEPESVSTPERLFAELARQPDTRLVVLGGEGAFRSAGCRGNAPASTAPRPRAREPLLFGSIPGEARELLRRSIAEAALREVVLADQGKASWPPTEVEPAVTGGAAAAPPALSVVIVGFGIPRQLENTLYSLSGSFQRNVRESDYEVILVENRSAAILGPDRTRSFGANFLHFMRDEPGVSPAPALNFGVGRATGRSIALMIDGARMVSPRVIEHTLLALRSPGRPFVVVPGYHLGPAPQHVSSLAGYDESAEQVLLSSVDWKTSGYRLFEIATFDQATENGFLSPLLEATFLACARECLEAISGADERFVTAGGGLVNLDLFDRLCRLEGTRCLMLWGEGNFHQYHGGVSSRGGPARDARLELFRNEYEQITGHPYAGFDREPVLVGTHSSRAAALLEHAATLGTLRHGMIQKMGRAEWPND